MTHRLILPTLALLLLLAVPARSAQADEPPATEAIRELLIERAVAHGADPAELLAVAQCESRLNPQAIGRAGERGLGQWHPGRFNAWDNTPAWLDLRIDIVQAYRTGDPDAIWYDADQLAWSMARNRAYKAHHWSCWRALFGGGG